MRKADIIVGARVRFQARHGEVVGTILEFDKSSMLVASDRDPIYRYRIPMSYVLDPKSTVKLGGKKK
jgi:hypothetical protein